MSSEIRGHEDEINKVLDLSEEYTRILKPGANGLHYSERLQGFMSAYQSDFDRSTAPINITVDLSDPELATVKQAMLWLKALRARYDRGKLKIKVHGTHQQIQDQREWKNAAASGVDIEYTD